MASSDRGNISVINQEGIESKEGLKEQKAQENPDIGYNGKISRADWKKKRENKRKERRRKKADEEETKKNADAKQLEVNKEANEQKKREKEEADAKAKKEEEDRIKGARTKAIQDASGAYAEKKNKCQEKKNEIAGKEKKDNKQELEKLQKEFKDLACGKYFDEHAEMHEEAHKKLAAESAAALADHKNRVHKAISEDIITSGSIFKIFSETLGKRSNVAMKRVLLKSGEFVDLVAAALEQKIKTSGLPAIMGIEIVTGIISFIIDIIPIPGIGILSTAVETAGQAVIDIITAVGPDSLIKTIEDKFLPIIEKIAVIFQGLAGSLSCCDKDKRADKINISSSTKNELIKSFKELKASIKKAGNLGGNKKTAAKNAIEKIGEALKFLGDEGEGKVEGGGLRRKTRRRRHHKTKRKLKRFRKTRVKKKHRKKRTRKH
jgi:hypothetical protein